MTIDSWLSLAAAIIPTVVVLLTRAGKATVQVETLSKNVEDFRDENRELVKELKVEYKDSTRDIVDQLSEIEGRVTKLEEFRHRTRNDLQLLVGHVDELRIRKTGGKM